VGAASVPHLDPKVDPVVGVLQSAVRAAVPDLLARGVAVVLHRSLGPEDERGAGEVGAGGSHARVDAAEAAVDERQDRDNDRVVQVEVQPVQMCFQHDVVEEEPSAAPQVGRSS
jgi:hypothetical protein